MPLPPSFSSTLGPTRVLQDFASGGPPIFSQFNSLGDAIDGESAAMQTASAAQQIRHFRLWNYIAIDRNAMACAQNLPRVGILKRAGAASRSVSLSTKQFLREKFSSVIRQDMDGCELEPADDSHPFVRLLDEVNATDWWVSFCYETKMFWQLCGCYYWWVIPNGFGLPAELYCIPPQWMTPVYSRSGTLQKWSVQSATGVFDLPPEEVIYVNKKSPFSKQSAWAPVTAGAEFVLNSEGIERVRRQSLAQGIYPSALIEIDPEHHDSPTEELITKIGDKFIERYGGSSRAARPLIQIPGTKVHEWGRKPNEMDFQNSGDAVRDSVLALHGTPRAMAGIAHDLNRANIEGAQLIYAERTILPMLVWLAGVLTWRLGVRFGDGLRVWFDDCRPRNAELDLKQDEADFGMGALTPQEVRAKRGRDQIPGEEQNQAFVSSKYTPIDKAGETPDPPVKGGRQPKDKGSSKKADQQSDDSEDGPAAQRQTVVMSILPESHYRDLSARFVSLHRRFEDGGAPKIEVFLKSLAAETLSRFDALAVDGSIPDVEAILPSPGIFERAFNNVLTPLWRNAAESGVVFEAELLGFLNPSSSQSIRQESRPDALPNDDKNGDGYPDISIKIPPEINRGIDEFLSGREVTIWKEVRETTREQLEQAIAGGITGGVREIRRRIESVLENETADRAMRIARTESTAAINNGQQSLRDAEAITNKVWLATTDGATRATHSKASMQVVRNDAYFVVGGYKMRFPGDGSMGAGAEEIVNCRCCATGYIDSDAPLISKTNIGG